MLTLCGENTLCASIQNEHSFTMLKVNGKKTGAGSM
jgi:hypothetical protein